MRVNGAIYYSTANNSNIDEYGEASALSTTWSGALPCSISVNSDNRIGRYDDGVFHQASYTILLEMMPFRFDADRVKLIFHGEDLGEFSVISIKPYTTMGRIEITV